MASMQSIDFNKVRTTVKK